MVSNAHLMAPGHLQQEQGHSQMAPGHFQQVKFSPGHLLPGLPGQTEPDPHQIATYLVSVGMPGSTSMKGGGGGGGGSKHAC